MAEVLAATIAADHEKGKSFADKYTARPLINSLASGRYKYRGGSAEGGMSYVYRAYDRDKECAVAIKLLKPELNNLEKAVARFLLEAETLARFDDENVIRLYDYHIGGRGGVNVIVQEYFPGGSVTNLLNNHFHHNQMGNGEWLQVVYEIGIQLCRGLEVIHAKEIVHQDLKPDNILFDTDIQVLKIIDFGIVYDKARVIETNGARIGTPRYFSPEQVSQSTIGPQADLYSLGIVLYELFTGDAPFNGQSDALCQMHLHKVPPRLTDVDANIPEAVADIVASCLEKDPARRPASAATVAETLIRWRPEKQLKDEALSNLVA